MNKEKQSQRMKNIYMQAKICSHLILTEINGTKVFLYENLSEEEKEYINKNWCNGI